MRIIPTLLGGIILFIFGGYTITWPAIFFGFLLLIVGLLLPKKKKEIDLPTIISEKQRNILRVIYLIFGFISLIYMITAIITFYETLVWQSYVFFAPIIIAGILLIMSAIVFFKHNYFIKIATIGSILGIIGTIICFYGYEIDLFTITQTVTLLGYIVILALNSIFGSFSK
jgi:uncharacterized membrane protein HdeD (DUF308 family)